MDSTFISLIVFVVLTILYYFFKPSPSLEEQPGASNNKFLYLAIYFVATIVSQFCINASIITANCGGSVRENIGACLTTTLIPWIFIFGSMIAVLMVFPGFKSAFSNIIGYFAVAGQANRILSKLLVNSEVDQQIDNEDTTPEHKQGLKRAAESILKLSGNQSIMINQMDPINFKNYWGILEPLMKREYFSTNREELAALKQQLFGLTVRRDNIGEALWYFYTAVLLVFIIQYNISLRGCVKTPETLAASLQEYNDQVAADAAAQASLDSQAYIS
jgi:hypothetical protein